jgi:hypothetical protein
VNQSRSVAKKIVGTGGERFIRTGGERVLSRNFPIFLLIIQHDHDIERGYVSLDAILTEQRARYSLHLAAIQFYTGLAGTLQLF